MRVCVARQGWRAPEERSFLGRKLVPYAFVHYIGASVLYTRLWPGTLSVPERRAIEAQGDELAGRSVVESRPRGRVVRHGLGVSFRVGAAQPPLASFLVVSFYRYTPLLTSNSTSVHPSFSFVLSVSLGFSRFLCQVPYSLPFSRVLSLSLSVQLAGARGSDPESSTALPRMAPLTAPLLHPRTSSRVPSLCVVHWNLTSLRRPRLPPQPPTRRFCAARTSISFFLSFFLSIVLSCVRVALSSFPLFHPRTVYFHFLFLTSCHLVSMVYIYI